MRSPSNAVPVPVCASHVTIRAGKARSCGSSGAPSVPAREKRDGIRTCPPLLRATLSTVRDVCLAEEQTDGNTVNPQTVQQARWEVLPL